MPKRPAYLTTSAFAFASIAAIAALVGILAFFIIHNNQAALDAEMQARDSLGTVLSLVLDEETGVRGFTTAHDRLFLQPYDEAHRRFASAAAHLRVQASFLPVRGALPYVDDLIAVHARWIRDFVRPLIAHPARKARATMFHGKADVDRMRLDVQRARAVVSAAILRTSSGLERSVAVSMIVIVLFVLVAGALALYAEDTRRRRERDLLRQIADRNVALARSNASLQEFAYAASHDLQEPLRTIAGFTQLLQRRYAPKLDAEAVEFIEFAVDGARRMQQLIDDILRYSRIATHGSALQPIALERCVDAARANLAAAIEESGAQIETGPLPVVEGDETQLTMLFQNLFRNAIKYCALRPHIRVSAAQAGEGWAVSVADNGIGIAPEYHDRIFRIFQRLHTRAEYEGTGVGLAICKGIVDRHGGRIWVESQAGKGAVFTFTLHERRKEGERA